MNNNAISSQSKDDPDEPHDYDLGASLDSTITPSDLELNLTPTSDLGLSLATSSVRDVSHPDPSPDTTKQAGSESTHDDSSITARSPSNPDDHGSKPSRRERNRKAAAKCRKKTRDLEDHLQEKERQLLQDNKALGAEINALRDEIVVLKQELLQHGDCDDELIQTHFRLSAAMIYNAYNDTTGLSNSSERSSTTNTNVNH